METHSAAGVSESVGLGVLTYLSWRVFNVELQGVQGQTHPLQSPKWPELKL